MKRGRKPRLEAVAKTTVYFKESDLDSLNGKNRFKALYLAKEISLKAVSIEALILRKKHYFCEVANNLQIEQKKVENYVKIWGELYDFESTSPHEFAGMIRDIVEFY